MIRRLLLILTLALLGTPPAHAVDPVIHDLFAPPGGDSGEPFDVAIAMVVEYHEVWSLPNAQAIPALPPFYADRIDFYGSNRSLNAVIENKRTFSVRWPDRDYRFRPNPGATRCDAAQNLCFVKGEFDWVANHPGEGRFTSGVSSIEMRVSFAGPKPVIVYENSSIIRRN